MVKTCKVDQENKICFFFKWEDTIKSITQVYLQQIRIKKYK